jgi:hypothetical protein
MHITALTAYQGHAVGIFDPYTGAPLIEMIVQMA